jgi:hypothetical protein
MAELLGEHWSSQVNDIIGWNVSWDISWCLLSSSPLAWSDASSISIRVDARSDSLNVISHIGWGTEVSIWDQSFSVTPYAVTSALSGALW